MHSYDILGARMLWKPKKSIKFVKIRVEECYDKVLNEEFQRILFCKMKNVITRLKCIEMQDLHAIFFNSSFFLIYFYIFVCRFWKKNKNEV